MAGARGTMYYVTHVCSKSEYDFQCSCQMLMSNALLFFHRKQQFDFASTGNIGSEYSKTEPTYP